MRFDYTAIPAEKISCYDAVPQAAAALDSVSGEEDHRAILRGGFQRRGAAGSGNKDALLPALCARAHIDEVCV